MLVLGFIFVCLWVYCTVDKMAVLLSFADVCLVMSFLTFVGMHLSSG